jgi:hypothetical protein
VALHAPPIAPVEKSPSKVTLKVAAGSGSFDQEWRFVSGMNDCGPIETPIHFDTDFTDVGGEIDYKPGRTWHVGVRGGFVRETVEDVARLSSAFNADSIAATVDLSDDIYYVNPYVAAEWTWIGFGGGLMLSSKRLEIGDSHDLPPSDDSAAGFSGHFRLGKKSAAYASFSGGESVPYYSGGGAINVGLGVAVTKYVDLWGGIATGPWPDEALLVRAEVHPSPRWSVGGAYRAVSTPGASGSFQGSGFSLGMSYHFVKE